MNVSTIKEKLQSALSIERYVHTLGVEKEAVKLAKKYGEDEKKAQYAALLHDCAKDYPNDLKKRLCKEYHIPLDDIMKKQIDLCHPFLGAEVAKREYEVNDEEILDAIRYHTTGRSNMTALDKIIFLADYIEEGRKMHDALPKARELAYEDLDEAVKFVLEKTIEYIKNKGRILHPLSQEALNFYKSQGGDL